MAEIKAFPCLRPDPKYAASIAALPYDVYNRQEAKAVTQNNPLSFLKIDRAETLCGEDTDIYSDEVYQKAKSTLTQMEQDGYFIQDEAACYYIYELTMRGHTQTGLVGCASIDDYVNGVIKKHENTRTDKEMDRIRHIDACSAQTGPIFLAYRNSKQIREVIEQAKHSMPLYDFTSDDKVTHKVWKVDDISKIAFLYNAFLDISSIYIADGHHRAASAVKVGLNRREQAGTYHGDEAYNYFLSVLFPEDELNILPYNRVVYDLNGHDVPSFLDALTLQFHIEGTRRNSYAPKQRHEFGMYLDKKWYILTPKDDVILSDPIDGLDVSILQDHVLDPILGIEDPKLDTRISFVGGIRGLGALQTAVDGLPLAVAFSMYPTSMDELFRVSDSGGLMPPKSTWFEPKLRSGLFVHKL